MATEDSLTSVTKHQSVFVLSLTCDSSGESFLRHLQHDFHTWTFWIAVACVCTPCSYCRALALCAAMRIRYLVSSSSVKIALVRRAGDDSPHVYLVDLSSCH
jgi:hypothetical protein